MGREARSEEPLYSIGTAARMLGISVHTVRMYEREGLVIPFRKESHQRLFSDADIERLRCTRQAITEEKVSIEGIKHMQSLIPCWEVLHCSADDRRRCPAYNGFEGPCWTIHRREARCADRSCRSCQVYKELFSCTSIKEKLKELV